MKYALTDTKGWVIRILDAPTDQTTAITDKQSKVVNANPKIPHFLVGGELLTQRQFIDREIAANRVEREAKRLAAMSPEQRAMHLKLLASKTPQPRAITKRELVDKLIDLGVAAKFNALLGKLPLEEKLRWEASPTIHPEYPFLVDNRAMILTALGITGEQFDNIFI